MKYIKLFESFITESSSDWKRFDGDELPDAAHKLATASWYTYENPFWEWYDAYYRNDGSKPEDWIVVTTGDYWKRGAISMTWWYTDEPMSKDGLEHKRIDPKLSRHVRAKANWSSKHLKKTIDAIKKGKNPPRDPNYQT